MTISEFFQDYYFHDSIFMQSGVDNETGNFVILCEFCNFMQKNYNRSEPTNSQILIIFQNPEFSGHVSEHQVLSQKMIDDKTIGFFLANEDNSEFLELVISADSVEIQTVKKYNL